MKYSIIFIFFLTISAAYTQGWQTHTISNDGIKPSLTIDKQNNVHIAFLLEDNSGWVKYTTLSGGTEAIETVSNGYFYGPLDIASDQNDNPIIAYHDHNQENQAVRKLEDGQWINLDTDHPGHDGWDNSIVVGSNGVIHTSSVDPSGFGGAGVEYGQYGFNGWTVEPIGSGPIMYANTTRIALNSNQKVYISYFDDQAGFLKLATKVNNNWQIETVDPGPNAGRFSSLLIDENDDIFISYLADGGVIKLASFKDNSWSFQTIDKLDNIEISFGGARNLTSLAKFGSTFGIAYGDKQAVKFATISENGISLDTVIKASVQNFGQIVSLAYNSEGTAFIAFAGNNGYGNANGNIFVAQKNISTTSLQNFESIQIALFPNPVKAGQFVYTKLNNFDHYQLFDLYGKLIYSGSISNYRIELPGQINPGNYLIKTVNNKPAVGYSKIVIIE